MPGGCCPKPCGSPCGRPYSCRTLLSNTQAATYLGYAPSTQATLPVTTAAGVYLYPTGEVFTLTCDAVVTLTFVANLYGVATGTVSVGLQVLNVPASAIQGSEPVPPIVQLSSGSIDAVTASYTVSLPAGTYKALVNLISLGSGTVNINITGALTVTSVKRYA
jgi:hypothetical protein